MGILQLRSTPISWDITAEKTMVIYPLRTGIALPSIEMIYGYIHGL